MNELSENIRLMDELLEDVVARTPAGRATLDLLRDLLELCRDAERKDDDGPRNRAGKRLAALPVEALRELLKVLTIRFHLANKAEQVEIVRINRERERAARRDRPRPESIAEAVHELKQFGADLGSVRTVLERLDIQPTLTAHPTEARRLSLLRQQARIASVLTRWNRQSPTPVEAQRDRETIRREIALMLATDEVRAERPQVLQEVRQGLYFLRGSIWRGIPQLYRDLRDALRTYY
ncbi:MAG: phosphoenolpyruvate carboxylase, partial [Planctomycetota bacterium]